MNQDTTLAGPGAGQGLPRIALPETDGQVHDLSRLPGLNVLYAYPRTSPPDAAPIEGWNSIPGARGCTPQSCTCHDNFKELRAVAGGCVFGLSAQGSMFQSKLVRCPILSFRHPVGCGIDVFRCSGHGNSRGGRKVAAET